MYIAMNRFKARTARGAEFENVWRERNSRLAEVPGFVSFKLLRGPDQEGVTLYASHSAWATEQAFVDWTGSEAFRAAHGGARTPEGVLLGPPQFEGFEVVLES
jgi:heme-degrading monooxygenase HmoA